MCAKELTYFGKKKHSELSDKELAELKNYKERFSKWQSKQIDLLTFCNNFIFTISIAISGFILAHQDMPIFNGKLICGKYNLAHSTLFLFAIIATLGIIALITRTNDFRLTTRITKARRRVFELDNDISYEDAEESEISNQKKILSNLKYWSKILGNTMWILFYLQITLLLLTIWLIVLSQ
ncbi:MAG TPA: hypothetical protein VFC67_00695 [Prolixibacteraceae bacterium]|nr:hypothetical protein [Prolixibacteraceae bacterium]